MSTTNLDQAFKEDSAVKALDVLIELHNTELRILFKHYSLSAADKAILKDAKKVRSSEPVIACPARVDETIQVPAVPLFTPSERDETTPTNFFAAEEKTEQERHRRMYARMEECAKPPIDYTQFTKDELDKIMAYGTAVFNNVHKNQN